MTVGLSGGRGVRRVTSMSLRATFRGFPLLALLASIVFTPAAPLRESPPPPGEPFGARFPVGALRPQVDFWKAVFTRFSSDQIVLHDGEYPEIVLEIVDLSDLRRRPDMTPSLFRALRRERIARALQRYRMALYALSVRPADSPLEHEVAEAYRGVEGPCSYERAARKLRLQEGMREVFLAGLASSGRYLAAMEAIFRHEGLPPELTRIPFVESMFDPQATSGAGAAGVWQLLPNTARRYLFIGPWVDDRRDPLLSTVAAARLLRRYREILKDWPLAITGYNHGVRGMLQATAELHTHDLAAIVHHYRGASFGFASRNFYTEFVAALEVERDRDQYFGPLPPAEPLRADLALLPSFVTLDLIESRTGIPRDVLRKLNPALSREVTELLKPLPPGYPLRVPEGAGRSVEKALVQIPRELVEHFAALYSPPPVHRVRRGEDLRRIARRFDVPAEEIAALNRLGPKVRLKPGQILHLPAPIPLPP